MNRPRIAFVLAFGILTTAAPSAEVISWTVDGQTREAIVFAPRTPAPGSGFPLVMAFHGFGDEVENFQHVDLHRAFSEAVVVYFQGLPVRSGLRGWQVERGQDGDRDLKLVDAALAALRKQFRIDADRVFATGFSNGGGLTYLLWAERPGVFAAFAPVAGRHRPSVEPAERRPLFHVAGTRDATVRFSDQQAAIDMAIRVNGVKGSTAGCGEGCTVYGADSLAPVRVWIHSGGHDYPRGTSEQIAAFFRSQRLRR